MTEREMEDLLYSYPDLLLGEPLKPVSRQATYSIGRADLIFEHPRGYKLIVEVKCGVAPRGVGDQLHDYWGAERLANPGVPIEMMVVAHEIPKERRLYLENRNIEPKEISVKKFRDVALAVGYTLSSEESMYGERSSHLEKIQQSSGLGASPHLGLSGPAALFANLDPENLELTFEHFKRKSDRDLAIGTDCPLRRAKEHAVHRVYFRPTGSNEVSARAEVVDILAGNGLPDPESRLPGYEQTPNEFYYVVRQPERLSEKIPVQNFIYFRTRNPLKNSAQGVSLIVDPKVI